MRSTTRYPGIQQSPLGAINIYGVPAAHAILPQACLQSHRRRGSNRTLSRLKGGFTGSIFCKWSGSLYFRHLSQKGSSESHSKTSAAGLPSQNPGTEEADEEGQEWRDDAASFSNWMLTRLIALDDFLTSLWQRRPFLVGNWRPRLFGLVSAALLLFTAVVNLWGVPSFNSQILPRVTEKASSILDRKVEIGKVKWIAPTGLTGMTPLAAIGPVMLGPSAREFSSASVPHVVIMLDPIQTVLQRKVILRVQANQAQVCCIYTDEQKLSKLEKFKRDIPFLMYRTRQGVMLKQMDNFSWFGYPDDVQPSVRNFLPGLKKSKSNEEELQGKPSIELSSTVGGSPGMAKLIEKEERRKLYPVPPEAAANFRPAVGKELVEQATQASAARRSKQITMQPMPAQSREKNLAAIGTSNQSAALQLGSDDVAVRSYAKEQSSKLGWQEGSTAVDGLLQLPHQDVADTAKPEDRTEIAVSSTKTPSALPEEGSERDKPTAVSRPEPKNLFASTSIRRDLGTEEDDLSATHQQEENRDLPVRSPANDQANKDPLPELRRNASLRDVTEQPVTLSPKAVFDNGGNSLKAKPVPLPGMIAPTVDVLQRAAGPDADIGVPEDMLYAPIGITSTSDKASSKKVSAKTDQRHTKLFQAGFSKEVFAHKASNIVDIKGMEFCFNNSAEALLRTRSRLSGPEKDRAVESLDKYNAKRVISQSQRPDDELQTRTTAAAVEMLEGLQDFTFQDNQQQDVWLVDRIHTQRSAKATQRYQENTLPKNMEQEDKQSHEQGSKIPGNLLEVEYPKPSIEAQERIRQSREASVSGREEGLPVWELQEGLRSHGILRRELFSRSASRRTQRSRLRGRLSAGQASSPLNSQKDTSLASLEQGGTTAVQEGPTSAQSATETADLISDNHNIATDHEDSLTRSSGDEAVRRDPSMRGERGEEKSASTHKISKSQRIRKRQQSKMRAARAKLQSQSIIMASTDAKRNPTLLHKLASRAAFVKAPDAIQTQSKGFRWTAPGWLSQGAETLQRLGKHIVDKANRNASRTDLAQEARHGNSTQGKSQESQRDSLSTSLRADAVDAAHQSAIPANEMTEPSPPQTGAISLGPEMSGKSFQLLSKRGSKKARWPRLRGTQDTVELQQEGTRHRQRADLGSGTQPPDVQSQPDSKTFSLLETTPLFLSNSALSRPNVRQRLRLGQLAAKDRSLQLLEFDSMPAKHQQSSRTFPSSMNETKLDEQIDSLVRNDRQGKIPERRSQDGEASSDAATVYNESPRPVIVEMAVSVPDSSRGSKGILGLENREDAGPVQEELYESKPDGEAPSAREEPQTQPLLMSNQTIESRPPKTKPKGHASKRHQSLDEDTEPRYKPGAQTLLGSNSKQGAGNWIWKRVRPVLQNAKWPQIGVESVCIRNGDLAASMVGEPIPRHISNVNATVRLRNNYADMVVDVSGNAHERCSASNRCTMSSPIPVRHLRDAPSKPITRLATDIPQAALDAIRGSNIPTSDLSFRIGGGMQDIRQALSDLQEDALSKARESSENPPNSVRKPRWWQRKQRVSEKPKGGRITAKIDAKGLNLRYPNTHISVRGRQLHAPMTERILELPMDVYQGQFDGEFKMHAYDAATWRLPLFYGRIKCSDMAFHFWDATDDFSKARMDLLLEGHRLYLHNASGNFGAVPLTVTGDMDLDPVTGQYRFTASVPSVEMNDLRRTLGIKPLPMPIGGALRGVLHCTGALEQPVFSGTAVAIPPTPQAISMMEDSNAKEVLQAEPKAAGAYDRIPFTSASAIFTMDTSNDIFLMHSLQAEPLHGGEVIGNGRMWVNPIAEHDPRAISINLRGQDLPFEAMLIPYLPKGMRLPSSLVMGEGSVQGTMRGSLLAPEVAATWQLPSASASGTAALARETNKVTCKAPAIDVEAALHVVPPDFEAVKRATTQAEISALAVPVMDGLDLDVNFKGLDTLPIISPPEALEHISSSQPLRLKVNGRVKFSGVMANEVMAGSEIKKSKFGGDLSLDSLRVNQLKLSRKLAGNLTLTDDSFKMQARGGRPDEALDVLLKLPLLNPDLAKAQRSQHSGHSAEEGAGLLKFSLADFLPNPVLNTLDRSQVEKPMDRGGGHFSLRCGQMLVSAEVNGRASAVQSQIKGLKLDELELASLRGEVEEANLRLDLEARQGRGQVVVIGPRFSGLQGESLNTAVRWDQDVVRLERANLQQKNSRYEVQGEYVIPANVAIPRSAASMALPPRDSDHAWSPFESSTGRWRLQVNVPTAQMEEILPAARLLSRATSPSPSDYGRAKAAFIQGVHEVSLQAKELGKQLEAAAESARAQLISQLPNHEEGASQKGGSRAALPGIQELKGHWDGTFQAYGGGGGAANVDFNMRGQDWTWGEYFLDKAVAQGACHSLEGVKIEELSLRAGEAILLIEGKLLTPDQDTSILLTDFPIALLDPIFRTVPALQNAAPAAGSYGAGTGSGSGFSGLSMPFTHRNSDKIDSLNRPAYPSSFSSSPVNGLLYVRGKIGGSAKVPEGELVVRLYDGAIGPTQLAQAEAHVSLDAAQRLSFGMDFAPVEPRAGGLASVKGSLPLFAQPQAHAEGAVEPSSENDGEDLVEVDVTVKDGGMKLVRILTPDFIWQSGKADIDLKLHGQPGNVALEGGMHISKATVSSPFLKYPMTNVAANVNLADNIVEVVNVEAKVGRKGFVRVKGDLPMVSQPRKGLEKLRSGRRKNAIIVEAQALELRLRNSYTGHLDASLRMRNSLAQPIVGGDIRLSKGTAMLIPQGAGPETNKMMDAHKEDDLVQKAFSVLTQREAAPDAAGLEEGSKTQDVPAVQLQGLQVRLGPELRAMFPVVVNMGISGDIEINGRADPKSMKLTGDIKLESGEINLVAAQLMLDREHVNRIIFDGQEGLDPLVDLSLRGAQIRALIQGRASRWHRHLLLTPTSAPVGEAAQQLQPSEAARIFEGQLASALVAEDGQLALSNLAVSAATGFMPKIQTQGQLGQARWRLVSAPSIPGLLSLDPTGDPTSLLSSLTMGTEVEVQFGNSLQAAMARKLRDSDIATQWTLNYQLNSKLRMQFTISSVHPYPRTLLFQYSGKTV